MDNKKIARILLGNSIYDELRSKKVFNPLEHPFPMQQLEDPAIDWKSYLNRSDVSGDELVYIVSPTQRSGTNFLSHILNYHPAIQFPEGENLPMEHCLYSAGDELAAYIEKTITYWGKWVLNPDDRDFHAKRIMGEMGTGLIRYLNGMIPVEKKLLLKTPDCGGIRYFFHLFPAAKMVFLVRDGRDTLESFTKSWGGKGAFKKMSARWSDRVSQFIEMKQEAASAGYGDQIHIAYYDKLNTDAKNELEKILSFIGVSASDYPWDKLQTAPVLGSSAYKEEGNVHWKPVERTEAFKPVDKWKSWNQSQRDIFREYAGEALINMGFEKDMKW